MPIGRYFLYIGSVLLALLFSVLAYRRIPVQLKPSVENPVITVSTVYRGASPVEVEQQVTRKVEDLLQAVDGLDEITSASLEGQSQVRLEYRWGVDKDRAVVDVINKLSELEDLPPDAEQPVVALTSQEGENAVMWICSTGHLPPQRVCVKCGAADSQSPESLSGLIGRVKSFTEDWLAYTPSPPYIYGNVEFRDGANVMLEFTDFPAGRIQVGDSVRLVFRIKDFDHKRNFRRYFWKAAPIY